MAGERAYQAPSKRRRWVRLAVALPLLAVGLACGLIGVVSDRLLRSARIDQPVHLRVIDVLIRQSERVVAIAPGERVQVHLSFSRKEAETLRLGDIIVAFPTNDEGTPYLAEAWIDFFWPWWRNGFGWSVPSLVGAVSLILAGLVAFVRMPTSRRTAAIPPLAATNGRVEELSDTPRESGDDLRKTPLRLIGRHWDGEYPLARSYWIHGVLFSLLLGFVITILEKALANESVDLILSVTSALLLFVASVAIWQFVGIWRSASRSARATGRRFWQGAAKVSVLLGAVLSLVNLATSTIDVAGIFIASRSNLVAEYMIERIGSTDLILNGSINNKSAGEIIETLEDPEIKVLRLRSSGGMLLPAERLARFVREREVMVLAEEECISACVIVLAASPTAAIRPGTKVSFHRPESLVEYSNAAMRAEAERVLNDSWRIYREFGVADWAIEIARKQQFWTPTLRQDRYGSCGLRL